MSKILADNLRLSIEHTEKGEVRISLQDDLSFQAVEIVYEVSEPRLKGGSRSYQLREAIVIAMRRLIGEAILAGLISDSASLQETYHGSGKLSKKLR